MNFRGGAHSRQDENNDDDYREQQCCVYTMVVSLLLLLLLMPAMCVMVMLFRSHHKMIPSVNSSLQPGVSLFHHQVECVCFYARPCLQITKSALCRPCVHHDNRLNILNARDINMVAVSVPVRETRIF